jgi:hypothetical protein
MQQEGEPLWVHLDHHVTVFHYHLVVRRVNPAAAAGLH